MAAPSDSSAPSSSSSSQRFSNKPPSEYFDPCQEFADRSLQCLKRNGGDKQMCTDYFQAYRDCKKAWMQQRKSA